VKLKGLTSILDTLKMIVGKRWPLIAAIFVIEIGLIIVVSNSAFFPSEKTAYEQQYNSTAAVLNQPALGQVVGIFVNNFRVATIELIPILGLVIFGFSLYETARIVEIIAIVKGVSVGLALGNLFFLPSTWLELPAYAIAAAESVYLVYAIYRGFRGGWARFVKEIRFLVVNIILIAIVLTVAAIFEVTEIQIEMLTASAPPTDPSHLYVLLTWLPFVAVFVGVITFWRRARREAPLLESQDAPLDTTQAPDAQGTNPTGGSASTGDEVQPRSG
jgi:uncharacterized membrane protein SpoIIM required for sporulation